MNKFASNKSHARSILTAAILAAGVIAPAAQATPLIGLTFNGTQLVFFDSTNPGLITKTVTVTGIGDTLVGIDIRPATGNLYGIGTGSILYKIDMNTGAATAPGPALSTPLSSPQDGFDFNPVADRVRIVGSTGQNLRVNPDTGAIAAVDTATSTTGWEGAAYDRSYFGTTATTLYVMSTTQLGIQGGIDSSPSPNGGVITPVGPLGVTTTADGGFDIGPASQAFAVSNGGVLPTPPNSPAGNPTTATLYSINLTTGAATSVGVVPSGLKGLAVVQGPSPSLPAVSGWSLAALIGGLLAVAGLARRRAV